MACQSPDANETTVTTELCYLGQWTMLFWERTDQRTFSQDGRGMNMRSLSSSEPISMRVLTLLGSERGLTSALFNFCTIPATIKSSSFASGNDSSAPPSTAYYAEYGSYGRYVVPLRSPVALSTINM